MNAQEMTENLGNISHSPRHSPNPFKTFRNSPLVDSMMLSPNMSPQKLVPKMNKRTTPRTNKGSSIGSPLSLTPTRAYRQPLSPKVLGSPEGRTRTPLKERTPKRPLLPLREALSEDLEIQIQDFCDEHIASECLTPRELISNPLFRNTPVTPNSPSLAHDAYGFLKYEDDTNRLFIDTLDEPLENKKFWEQWLVNRTLDDSLYQHIVEHGVTHELRAKVWPLLLGVREYKESQTVKYNELRLKGRHQFWARQIDLDLHRTYGTHTHFLSPSSRGQKALSNVLNAFAHFKENIGYCQGMGFLVGLLLMNMDEEASFWTFATLLDKCDMLDYYEPKMSGLLRDSSRINQMIKASEPQIYHLLVCLIIHRSVWFDINSVVKRDFGIDCTLFVSRWFLQLFTDLGDWRTILKIWDYIMLHKKRGLFHVALGIIHGSKDDLLKVEPDMIFHYLLNVPLDKIDPSYLFYKMEQVDIDALFKVSDGTPFMTPIKIRTSPKPSILRRIWSKFRTPSREAREHLTPKSAVKSPSPRHSNRKSSGRRPKRLSPLAMNALSKRSSPSPLRRRLKLDDLENDHQDVSFKEFIMRTPSKDALLSTPLPKGSKSVTKKSTSSNRIVLSPIEMVSLSK